MTEPASRYDVIVIGGGVIGLSCARELRRAGIERVCVLEKDDSCGQASSARANGGVRAQFTTPVNIQFSLHSIAEFEALEAAGHPIGFHQEGYLFFTGVDETLTGLRAAAELQRSLGVETIDLTPEEVAQRAPLVRAEGILGGTFHARDGFLDPYAATMAMHAECRALGVEIRTRSEVVGAERSGDHWCLQDRSGGVLDAAWVVDAAGAHAGSVAQLFEAELDVFPVRRCMAFVPDPHWDGTLPPMMVDVDSGVLVRREASGGFLIAWADPEDLPGFDISFDPRWLVEVGERIGTRFPFLEELAIDPRHCWGGLYPETADHHAIVGPAPDIPHLIFCAGFGGHGIMHAPAAGRAVAELITQGRCTSFDLHALRAERFAEGDQVVETAVF